MKKIILLLLLLVILIPTTVNAQGGVGPGVEILIIDGVEFELVAEIWVWHNMDGETWEETKWVWQEVKHVSYVENPYQHYDPNTGKIICWNACWHEVGHKIDWEVMDKISESNDFHYAVRDFLYYEMVSEELPHPMAVRILLFPGFFNDFSIFPDDAGRWAGYVWGGYDELYAEILYWADGNFWAIPRNLREFYDMEAAQQMYDDVIAASDETIY